MNRKALNALYAWKGQSKRKPLILQGARQVGKTWLMKQFGREAYSQVAYFNFEAQRELAALFSNNLNPSDLIRGLSAVVGFRISAENCLILLDEIQECPDAISSLKYFHEDEASWHIIAAGSLLGVALHQGLSFPVGKVEFLELHPLDFEEFLDACGKPDWIEFLRSESMGLVRSFEAELKTFLGHYLFVGGMPEAVLRFTEDAPPQSIRDLQRSLLQAYENDFSKHAPVLQLPRIRLVWNAIVPQLAKENSKFIYNVLRPGARAKDFELAIEWLTDAGLVHKVHRITKSGLPISAYADWNDFKLFFVDVGLLGAQAQMPIPNGVAPPSFTEFKGVLAEQFVLQQLLAAGFEPYYWHPENAQAEIDFVIQHSHTLIPIEVKSGTRLHSKSLWVYHAKYAPSLGIRTSLVWYEKNDWLNDVPLYALMSYLCKLNAQQ
jgi:hypothetical protein